MSEPITEAEVAALEIYYKEEGHFMILPLCAAWRSLTAENERLVAGQAINQKAMLLAAAKIDEQAAEIANLKAECERLRKYQM